AEQVGEHGAAERRGLVGVEGLEDDVRGHHRGYAGLDGGAERHQLACLEHLAWCPDRRQGAVGVGDGGPVPGEVLDAGGHPAGGQALDERDDVPGHGRRVGAEAAGADDRVARVGVDVRAGCEVHPDPGAGELGTDPLGDQPGDGGVVVPAQGGGRGIRAAGGRVQPGDVPALLVHGQDRGGGDRTDRAGEPGEVAAGGDVAAVEADPAEALLVQPGQPGRDVGSGEAGEQHRVGRPVERAHPFTAPETSPAVIRAWTNMKKTMTGTATRTDPAMTAGQSMASLDTVVIPRSHSGRVRLSGSMTTTARVYSFHAWRKAKTPLAMRPGASSGKVTVKNARTRLQPSTIAASSSSTGTPSAKPRSSQTVNGRTAAM